MKEQSLPIFEILRLAGGSWAALDDLVHRVSRQPDQWVADATRALGLDHDVALHELELAELEAARERLRTRRADLETEVVLFANLLIVTVGVARDRMLTSASVTEVEYAITALTGALPESWDDVLDRALTSPLLDPPAGRAVG